jgi:acyl-coenzyme A thioesterase PaaI-like protein
MTPVPLAANHVGSVYAGASFTIGEMAAGALLGLIGGGEIIPVLVGADIEYVAPAKEGITAEASVAEHMGAEIRERLREDRRTVSAIEVTCCSEERLCVRATYRYRWLGSHAGE